MEGKYNILMMDDEKEIVDLVDIHLRNEQFRLFRAHTGKECLDVLQNEKIDLAVLDIMMPDVDGMSLCAEIRKTMNIPIIMLSAKSEDMDKVMGLSAGADDYMTKPFNPIELIARIKSQMRRFFTLSAAGSSTAQNTIIVGGLEINTLNHSVFLYRREIKLTPTEYDILLLLAGNAGKVFGSEEIFETVWKEKYLDANNTIMVHIWKLREKIEDNPKQPEIIKTVWGVGYKIENG